MTHDFKNYPELRNSQMNDEYANSPHRQILEDFTAVVEKVHDGDTITLSWKERDFKFPMRIVDIDAPELNEEGGHEARDYLENFLEGSLVMVIIDKDNRVEKWGRLLGDIMHRGIKVSELMLGINHAVPFDDRNVGELTNIKKEFNPQRWLT